MLYYYHKDAIHISKIDLLVNDLSVSKSFYTEALGFSILSESENQISLTVDFTHEIICLHKSNNSNISYCQEGLYDFAILLPSRIDLSKFLHHCIAKQIPIDGAADHLVSEAIYLRDPDGIGIEISCDREDSTWEVKDHHYMMDALPFDYEGVFYEINNTGYFQKLPQNTVIGHLHLYTSHLNRALEFYRDIIGFQVVNLFKNDSVFLADKNYHHHICINALNPNLPLKQNILSITVSYPNCEKFKKSYDSMTYLKQDFKETHDGIQLVDPENIKITLKLS